MKIGEEITVDQKTYRVSGITKRYGHIQISAMTLAEYRRQYQIIKCSQCGEYSDGSIGGIEAYPDDYFCTLECAIEFLKAKE